MEADLLEHGQKTKRWYDLTSGQKSVVICVIIFVIALITATIVTLSRRDSNSRATHDFPIVATTWPLLDATSETWSMLTGGNSALDSLEKGCNYCEENPNKCNFAVGFGGSPNSAGETTLDAIIMSGTDLRVGAVGNLKRVKKATSVARQVMEQTEHVLLVGSDATNFAVQFGFQDENLNTTATESLVLLSRLSLTKASEELGPKGVHTIFAYTTKCRSGADTKTTKFGFFQGMITIDDQGNLACGSSSNGAQFKIPGQVGQASLPGAAVYCDNDAGGAVATGEAEVIMKYLPAFRAVLNMKNGMAVNMACKEALSDIKRNEYTSSVGLLCMNNIGDVAAYGVSAPDFQIVYQEKRHAEPQIISGKSA